MADGTSDAAESATVEGPAAAWLAERADELGVSTEEFLTRVVAAYRAAETGDAADVVTEEDLAAVEEDFESALDDVDSEFGDQIQDVRERVIQVKREADAKAAADHDHPGLADRADDALAAVRDLEAEFADLADSVDGVADRVDAGFENFEEVLRYLRDETDDLADKLTTLATAVLSMRESVASLAAADARRERTDRLKRAANRANVREADCGDCGAEVAVGLLTAPECPACGATFEDVEANEGWFGTHELLTGSAPALTSGEHAIDDDEPWLGADTETLEAMASGDDAGDDGPDIVEPSGVEDAVSGSASTDDDAAGRPGRDDADRAGRDDAGRPGRDEADRAGTDAGFESADVDHGNETGSVGDDSRTEERRVEDSSVDADEFVDAGEPADAGSGDASWLADATAEFDDGAFDLDGHEVDVDEEPLDLDDDSFDFVDPPVDGDGDVTDTENRDPDDGETNV